MSKPWSEFTSWSLTHYRAPFYSKSTHYKLRRILTELSPACATTDCLEEAVLQDWILSHPEMRPETLRGYLRSLAAACASSPMKLGFWPVTPFAGLSIKRLTNRLVAELPPDVHTLEEIRAVLALADARAAEGTWRDGRLRAVLYLLAYTGMRAREALGLRVEDIDLFGRLHIFSKSCNPSNQIIRNSSNC